MNKITLTCAFLLTSLMLDASPIKSSLATRHIEHLENNSPNIVAVQYLESDGQAWIDTGVLPLAICKVSVLMSRIRHQSYVNAYWGCWGNGSANDVRDGSQFGMKSCYRNLEIGSQYYTSWSYINLNLITTLSLVSFSMPTNRNQKGIDVQIGEDTYHFDQGYGFGYWGLPSVTIALFGGKTPNGMTYPCNPKDKLKIGSFKIEDENGQTVIDMVAVRFRNEKGQFEGAMFNRANPTLGMDCDGSPRDDGIYRNRGTGAFVIGPDR